MVLLNQNTQGLEARAGKPWPALVLSAPKKQHILLYFSGALFFTGLTGIVLSRVNSPPASLMAPLFATIAALNYIRFDQYYSYFNINRGK